MRSVAYFEAFDRFGNWFGTATLAAITKAGLVADLTYPLYAPVALTTDGWACRAKS